MSRWLGIDLGTSSVRALLLDERGEVLGVQSRAHPIISSRPGFAEQDPEQWWVLTAAAVRDVLAGCDLSGADVQGVGLSGQMHGLVTLDGAGRSVRPAIIWPDLRCAAQVAQLESGPESGDVRRISGMSPATGQFGPNLAWLAQHEPGAYSATRHALSPKDYVRFRLTGQIDTEPTDACGTLLFDIRAGVWSDQLVDAMGLDMRMLPDLVGCTDVVGLITADAAAATGLRPGTPVVAGAGDQAAASVALGLADQGSTSVAVSSGGTVVQVTSDPGGPPVGGLHTLCAADRRWLLMGATLTAGLALAWVVDLLAENGSVTRNVDELVAAAGALSPGAEGLLFLPYLAGERTPHMDAAARGSFLGLSRRHGRAHLTRAVLEGVAFALRDCLETVVSAGSRPTVIVASGGGTRNPVWRQIISDVLGLPIQVSPRDEHSATGAAMLAARGISGSSPSVPPPTGLTLSNRDHRDRYDQRFELFHQAYQHNRSILHALAGQQPN